MADRLVAYRVWLVDKETGYEGLASTAYTKKERAQEICDRHAATNGDWATFDVRSEQVPGELLVNGAKMKSVIVIVGDDQKHTRFS